MDKVPPTGYLLTSQGFLVSTLLMETSVSFLPVGERRFVMLTTAQRPGSVLEVPKGSLLFGAGCERGSAAFCLEFEGERAESLLLLLS